MAPAEILIRRELRALFLPGRGRQRSDGLTMLIGAGAMVYLSVLYSLNLYRALPEERYADGFLLMTALGVAMIFFTGISKSQGMLFGFKDYDFLMSLPLKESAIVTAKLTTYMVLEYFTAGAMVIPAAVIYGLKAHAPASFYILALTGFLFLPMVPMALSSLIGLLIRRLSAGRKHEALFRNGMTILLVAVIWYVSFTASGSMYTADAIHQASGMVGQLLPLVRDYVLGCTGASFLPWLRAALISLAAAVCFVRLLSPLILRINARGLQGYHEKNFRLSKARGHSRLKALYDREAVRYFRNFNYVMNTCAGLLMLVMAALYMVFNREIADTVVTYITSQDAAMIDSIMLSAAVIAGASGHMSCSTGVSISLEGPQLWITKMLPVSVRSVFLSKVLVNMTVILVPLSVFTCILAFFLHPSGWILPAVLVYLILVAAFTGMFGLAVNLRFPKLDYDREITVIKQSVSSFVSLLGSMAIGGGLCAVFFTQGGTIGTARLFLLFLAGYAAADLLLAVLLATWGEQRFRTL